MESVGGRSYAGVYAVHKSRSDVHELIVGAVEASGGELLFVSGVDRAPVFLGVQIAPEERLGILCYPFRCNKRLTVNRPADEHRIQIRYGGEESWSSEHPVGFDIAGVDTTIVVGVHVEAGIFIGLDPRRYDPLPMGISVELKDEQVEATQQAGWHVWDRVNRSGTRRKRNEEESTEALIGFSPSRFLDFVRFERRATGLGLDGPLRFRSAQIAKEEMVRSGEQPSTLLEEFNLTSHELLDIIAKRARLHIAVKGGVAEFHLFNALRADAEVAIVTEIDEDAQPDCRVTMRSGPSFLVECKNVSPTPYNDGSARVEVQKTRSQKNDPAGRFYRPEQFEVVAACLYARTGLWEFRFKRSELLDRHAKFPDRLAAAHRVDLSWSSSLAGALSR